MSRQREVEVTLGDHEYTVVPQRWGRLKHKLGDAVTGLADLEGEGLLDTVGAGVYRLLSVMIPDLMPEHEFDGFASAEAQKGDDYVEAADRSPDPDQIVTALEACMHANRIDLLKGLGKVVGTEFLTVASQKVLADFLTNTSPSSSSRAIPSTTSTTSGATSPTSDVDGTSSPIPPTPAPAPASSDPQPDPSANVA